MIIDLSLKFNKNNGTIKINIPNYLNEKQEGDIFKIIVSYFPEKPVFTIDTHLLYDNKFIWTVNNLEELIPVAVNVLGTHFDGANEKWVISPINKKINEINLVTTVVTNVAKKQQVKINDL